MVVILGGLRWNSKKAFQVSGSTRKAGSRHRILVL
jgi:hypothetical protein